MKRLTILCLLLISLTLCSVCRANDGNNSAFYTRAQVDSIVAVKVQQAVQDEVTRRVDTELIDLKIDKAANDKLGTYITEQNNHLTLHDLFIGAIITILVTIAGIVVPLIINRDREKKVKELTNRLNTLIQDAKHYEEIAKASARYAEFSVKLTRALYNDNVGVRLSILTGIIKDYKDEAFVSDAYIVRAMEYIKMGKMGEEKGDENRERKKAISDYTKAIEKNPKSCAAFNARGFSYHIMGEYDNAIKDFNAVINLDPNYYLAYLNRGNSYRKLGKYDEAIKDFTEAMELDFDFYKDKAYYFRGLSYGDKREFEEAIKDFSEAIRLNPCYARVYLNRCKAYQERKQLDNALVDAEHGLQIAKKQGRTDDLIEAFEKKINEIKRGF